MTSSDVKGLRSAVVGDDCYIWEIAPLEQEAGSVVICGSAKASDIAACFALFSLTKAIVGRERS